AASKASLRLSPKGGASMSSKPILCTISFALCASAGPIAAQTQPVFIPLDADTLATGISADGSLVVGSYFPNGTGAFYWTQQTGTVAIGGNSVGGVSADGATIVGRAFDGLQHENAAIWMGGVDWYLLGSFTPEAIPCDQLLSSAFGVNGDGSVVVGLGWN